MKLFKINNLNSKYVIYENYSIDDLIKESTIISNIKLNCDKFKNLININLNILKLNKNKMIYYKIYSNIFIIIYNIINHHTNDFITHAEIILYFCMYEILLDDKINYKLFSELLKAIIYG